MNDITLITGLKMMSGKIDSSARLYYFEGNFFWPFFGLNGCEVGRIKRAIREFTKENLAMVREHQARSDYKTILDLFDCEPQI